MKAIIWKELRENFKWAGLALIALALAECYALAIDRSGSRDSFNNLTLISSTFLMVTSFGCALVGAVIGALQVVPEQRRDQWAALLHRPVNPGMIYAGKAVAGVLLVIFATAIPFVLSVGYVAMPGQFAAPLVPGMLYPGFSDLFLGLVFYFAALAVCLSQGRWWGRRGALALSVVPFFVLHITGAFPIASSSIASLGLLLAGWGAMTVLSATGKSRAAGRLAGTAMVWVGSYAALLIAGFVVSILPWWPKPEFSPGRTFRVTTEGDVFIATWKSNGSESDLTDLDGKPVTDERFASNDEDPFLSFAYLTWSLSDDSDFLRKLWRQRPRLLMNYVRVADRGSYGPEFWYLLVEKNIFVGYDKLSRRAVGTFGRSGFQPPGKPAEPFPQPLQAAIMSFYKPFLYWSGPRLYRFDFGERKMTSLLDADNARIYGAAAIGSDRNEPAYVAVALDNELRIVSFEGQALTSLPYPHDPKIWSELSIAITPQMDRIYLQSSARSLWWTSPFDNKFAAKPTFLDEIALDGTLLRRYSLSNPPPVPQSPSLPQQFFTFTTPLVPAALGAFYHEVRPSRMPNFQTTSYPRPNFRMSPSELGIILALSVGLAALTWFWARRASFSPKRAGGWTVFVFCLGLPGLIAFRLAADWPVRIPCPSCGKKRAVAQKACACCQQEWPEPESTGYEIFDTSNQPAA